MKKGSFHSSGRLDVDMYIDRFRIQRFVFTAEDVAFDITAFNWQLNIKNNVGKWNSVLTLGMGTGLSFPVYETNILEARFEIAQVSHNVVQEGPMYWELVRTDTSEIWISGVMEFKYGLLDSGGSDQEVTVNLTNQTVSVDLQAIIQVNDSGGSGGTFEIVDYSGIALNGLPTGVDAGYIARVILESPFTPVFIGGVSYEHNAIIYKNAAGDWISWSGNYGTQT